MDQLSFLINERPYTFSIQGSPDFAFGAPERLSRKDTDITFDQPWYEAGYDTAVFAGKEEFQHLLEGLNTSIGRIVTEELGVELGPEGLSKYHHVVRNYDDHFKVIARTRDLFPNDFNFPIDDLLPKFSELLGIPLTDINPHHGRKMHIIVRINRPGSTDYNPPHKDVYQAVDIDGYIPQFVNLWIPICGVTERSSLPLAPGSHLIPEDKVLRTFAGGVVEGNKYGVRTIKEWDGSNKLERPHVNYGEVLFFSSHLVHGLAINEEPDNTRVALEFRLFKKS